MAKSFDALVRRATTKQTRAKAAKRTQELFADMTLALIRQQSGRSQKPR